MLGCGTHGSTAPGIAAKGDESSRSGAGLLCCAGSRGLAMEVIRGGRQHTGQTAVKTDAIFIPTAKSDQTMTRRNLIPGSLWCRHHCRSLPLELSPL